jgi:hypothetical protein
MTYSSYVEYLRLPEFRAVVNRVKARSGGVCEWCGKRPAIEPHHVTYCRWGEVDTELNLLFVCSKCHCDLHRCSECCQVTLKAADIKSGSRVCRLCRSGSNGG